MILKSYLLLFQVIIVQHRWNEKYSGTFTKQTQQQQYSNFYQIKLFIIIKTVTNLGKVYSIYDSGWGKNPLCKKLYLYNKIAYSRPPIQKYDSLDPLQNTIAFSRPPLQNRTLSRPPIQQNSIFETPLLKIFNFRNPLYKKYDYYTRVISIMLIKLIFMIMGNFFIFFNYIVYIATHY